MVDCYVGMGGNFTNTPSVMHEVVEQLKSQKELKHFTLSRFYRTTAVSPVPQPDYLNAVCRFQTDLSLSALWQRLTTLELEMGKKEKPKNQPRLIDLDLLFYGSLISMTEEVAVPHPRWHERLFVLAPLADVTDILPIEGGISIHALLKRFSNPNHEKIYLYEDCLCTK